jgi:hypothetical protein
MRSLREHMIALSKHKQSSGLGSSLEVECLSSIPEAQVLIPAPHSYQKVNI